MLNKNLKITLSVLISFVVSFSILVSFVIMFPVSTDELVFHDHPTEKQQSNFYLQIHPITDSVSITELEGLLLDDPLATEPSLIAVNLSNNGRISLNIREYLQLHHFGYIQNRGLKMEVANTVSPFNTYSFFISNLDSLAPKLIIQYVAP